jgi:hypothetical protein
LTAGVHACTVAQPSRPQFRHSPMSWGVRRQSRARARAGGQSGCTIGPALRSVSRVSLAWEVRGAHRRTVSAGSGVSSSDIFAPGAFGARCSARSTSDETAFAKGGELRCAAVVRALAQCVITVSGRRHIQATAGRAVLVESYPIDNRWFVVLMSDGSSPTVCESDILQRAMPTRAVRSCFMRACRNKRGFQKCSGR